MKPSDREAARRLANPTLDVVTLGEALVALTAEQIGPMRNATTFRRHAAGSELNVAVGLARLGLRCGWVGRLGDDEFGHFLFEYLRAEGVDTSRVRFEADAPTGIYFKEWRVSGRVRVQYYRRYSAATRMQPEDLDEGYLAGARWLHVTGITPALGEGPRRTIRAALAAARRLGVPVSLDPNYRSLLWDREEAAAVLRELARDVTVLLPSLQEAQVLVGPGDAEELTPRLLDLGPEQVVIKAGARGAYYATRSGESGWVPPFRVEVVDPVGAGDAFAAGFLAGLLEGKCTEDAIRLGHACGAFAVGVPGDTEGLPFRAEVEQFLREQGGTDVHR